MVGILLPFGVDPGVSFGILLKYLDFVALAIALPVLLSTRRRTILFMLCGALAITALVAWDLTRLLALYGSDVLVWARKDPNPVLIHPNISAVAAAAAAVLAGTSALSQRRSKPVFLVLLLVAALNVVYLVLLRSRGAQLALFVSICLTALVSVRSRRAFVGVTALAVCCAAALLVVNPRFRTFGVLDRDVVWKHTASLVAEHPIVGYGLGEPIFMEAYHSSEPPESPHHFHHPHMYWMNALFCFGWPATMVQAGMWLMLAIRLARKMPSLRLPDARVERAGAFALLVLIQVAGIFDCTPNILGLTVLWCVPLALAVSFDQEPVNHA